MRPGRALFLAYYFPPMGGMGSLRALGLARHLPAAGVSVTVVAPRTGTYAHDDSLEVPDGLEVVRTGTLEPAVLKRRWASRPGPGSGLGGPSPARAGGRLGPAIGRAVGQTIFLPDSNNGWIPFAVRAALRAARRRSFDLVLSSAPPLSALLAASLVASRLRVPLVADFRDFFRTQRLYPGVRQRVDRWVEDRIFARAAGVVAATDGIRDELAGRTSAPSLVLPNGYDEDDFSGSAQTPDGPFRLVHVGSSYAHRKSPAALFRAVRSLRDGGEEIRLRFVGAPDPALVAAARAAGIADALDVAPFSTHRAAVAEMRAASALLLFVWADDPVVAKGARAGKTPEYLRSGRPVLFLGPEDGENARVLRDAGGAVIVSPDDEAGIRAALADLSAGRAPAGPDAAVVAGYSREAGARRLADWLATLPVGPAF